MIPRILVAAPTSNLKDYCFEEYVEQVRNFTYPNYDILLVDNSEDKKYHHKILEAGIRCIHHKPKGSPIEYITECQNIIRGVAIEGGYDYVFMLESDVFVPANIIEHMLCGGADVYTITYFITKKGKHSVCLHGMPTNELRTSTKVLEEDVSAAVWTGEIKDIKQFKIGEDFRLYGTGIGCTLFKTSVLKEIPFRIDKQFPAAFSDSYWYLDAERAGITTILDTSLIATHKSFKIK